MIAESGHYALVLAFGLALVQSTVPLLGARWREYSLMNVARSTAVAQLIFCAASFAAPIGVFGAQALPFRAAAPGFARGVAAE